MRACPAGVSDLWKLPSLPPGGICRLCLTTLQLGLPAGGWWTLASWHGCCRLGETRTIYFGVYAWWSSWSQLRPQQEVKKDFTRNTTHTNSIWYLRFLARTWGKVGFSGDLQQKANIVFVHDEGEKCGYCKRSCRPGGCWPAPRVSHQGHPPPGGNSQHYGRSHFLHNNLYLALNFRHTLHNIWQPCEVNSQPWYYSLPYQGPWYIHSAISRVLCPIRALDRKLMRLARSRVEVVTGKTHNTYCCPLLATILICLIGCDVGGLACEAGVVFTSVGGCHLVFGWVWCLFSFWQAHQNNWPGPNPALPLAKKINTAFPHKTAPLPGLMLQYLRGLSWWLP